MPARRLLPRAATAVAVPATLLAMATAAWAAPGDRAPYTTDTTTKGNSPAKTAVGGDSTFSSSGHQHGGVGGHLPGSSANVKLVSKLEPTNRFGSIVPGQIADLAVYKNF